MYDLYEQGLICNTQEQSLLHSALRQSGWSSEPSVAEGLRGQAWNAQAQQKPALAPGAPGSAACEGLRGSQRQAGGGHPAPCASVTVGRPGLHQHCLPQGLSGALGRGQRGCGDSRRERREERCPVLSLAWPWVCLSFPAWIVDVCPSLSWSWKCFSPCLSLSSAQIAFFPRETEGYLRKRGRKGSKAA